MCGRFLEIPVKSNSSFWVESIDTLTMRVLNRRLHTKSWTSSWSKSDFIKSIIKYRNKNWEISWQKNLPFQKPVAGWFRWLEDIYPPRCFSVFLTFLHFVTLSFLRFWKLFVLFLFYHFNFIENFSFYCLILWNSLICFHT